MISSIAIAKPLPSPIPQNIIDLADRSLDIGYKGLAKRVQRVSAFHEGASILKKAGIDVYHPNAVERYKTIAIVKAKYRMNAKYLIYTGILSAVTYAFFRLCITYKAESFGAVFFGVLGLAAVCTGIVSLVAYFVNTFSNNYTLEWDSHSLESYDRPIPENVLITALAIREELPRSELRVEELRAKRRVIDPFMYVVYKDVRLYVSVWDEPKFTGKML